MNHPIRIGDQEAWYRDFGEDKRYDYPPGTTHWIIDIGAFEGEFTLKMLDKFPYCEVLAFEPDPAARLVMMSGLHTVEKRRQVGLVPGCAWTKRGRITLGGESFWTSWKEKYNLKEYECFDIASYILGPRDFDVCKINIEGGEYELLDYMIDKGLMKHIRNLQVQFHLVEGEDSERAYAMLWPRLAETHELEWRCPFVWENWKLKR